MDLWHGGIYCMKEKHKMGLCDQRIPFLLDEMEIEHYL